MARTIFTGPTPPQPADRPARTSFGEGLSGIAEMIRRQAVEEQFAKISQLGLAAQAGVNPFQASAAPGTTGPRGRGGVQPGTQSFLDVERAGSPREQFLASIRSSGVQIRPEFHEMIQGFLDKLPGPPQAGKPFQRDLDKAVQQVTAEGEVVTLPGGEAALPVVTPEMEAAQAALNLLQPGAPEGNIRSAAQLLISSGDPEMLKQGTALLKVIPSGPSETEKEIARLVDRGFTEADASDIARGRVEAVQHPTNGTTQLLNTVTGAIKDTDVSFEALPTPTPQAEGAAQLQIGEAMTGFEAVKFASAKGAIAGILQRVGGEGSIADILDVFDTIPDVPPEASRALTALDDLRLGVLSAYRIPGARVKMTFEAADNLVPKAGLLQSVPASTAKMLSLFRRVTRDKNLAIEVADNPKASKDSRLASAEQVRQFDRLLLIIGDPEGIETAAPITVEPQLSSEAQAIFDKHERGLEIDAEDAATLEALSPEDLNLLAEKMGLTPIGVP